MFLVINDNKGSTLLPFSERYRLFADVKDAIKHAKSIGWSDFFGFGVSTEPGTCSTYQVGGIKVGILPLEVH